MSYLFKSNLSDFYQRANILGSNLGYDDALNALDKMAAERRLEFLAIPFWKETLNQFEQIKQDLSGKVQPSSFSVSDYSVVQTLTDFPVDMMGKLYELLVFLRPWRKGPFQIKDILIDAEWRSDLKWNRIFSKLEKLSVTLKNKTVLDLGCNNGYYLFHIAKQNPRALLGFDPNGRFLLQFEIIKLLTNLNDVTFEPLGIDELAFLPAIFEVIFCLGVLYHRKDPLGSLSLIKEKLSNNGTAVIESITVPGKEGEVLFPKERYSKMRNVYFIPTAGTLVSWMERVGFKNVQIIDQTPTTIKEQRKTFFAHFDSLEDFLDPNDHSKTIEGYPAPERTTVIGQV